MRRFLTGSVLAYNRRHHRHGHLFHNRSQSLVCEAEGYLTELVRYDLLDRHLGASLLRFLLTGVAPTLDEERLERSAELLFQNLERQGLEGFKFERNRAITIPGLPDAIAPIYATRSDGAQFVIGLHGPLTPDDPSNDALRELKEYSTALLVLLIDELVVRRNLPSATSDLIAKVL